MQPDATRWNNVRRLLGLAEINRAVLYALTLRGWQLAAGAVSAILIATLFTPEEQGFWFTFSGLIALQTFFELGFSIAVINIASHEWAELSLDENGTITGNPAALSRLVSLGRLLFRWYAVAAVAFMLLVGAFGYYFLSDDGGSVVDWHSPWIVVASLAGLSLWTLPFVALLEGCNQVATVNRYRLIQAIVANVTVWTAISLGAGLWAFAAVTLARLLCEIFLLLVKYRRFFACMFAPPERDRLSWRHDVLPLQWRLALGGMFQYFSINFLTLVMFRYESAAVAGQMGMTWTLITTLNMACLAWMQTRVPQFGMLIARQEFDKLDLQFRRLLLISLGAVAVAGLALWLVVYSLQSFGWQLGTRLLPALPTGMLIGAVVLKIVPDCLTYYIRAHKREPTPLLLVIIASHSGVGLLVWLLGGYLGFGAIGAAAAYLGVIAVILLPGLMVIWMLCRRAWH